MPRHDTLSSIPRRSSRSNPWLSLSLIGLAVFTAAASSTVVLRAQLEDLPMPENGAAEALLPPSCSIVNFPMHMRGGEVRDVYVPEDASTADPWHCLVWVVEYSENPEENGFWYKYVPDGPRPGWVSGTDEDPVDTVQSDGFVVEKMEGGFRIRANSDAKPGTRGQIHVSLVKDRGEPGSSEWAVTTLSFSAEPAFPPGIANIAGICAFPEHGQCEPAYKKEDCTVNAGVDATWIPVGGNLYAAVELCKQLVEAPGYCCVPGDEAGSCLAPGAKISKLACERQKNGMFFDTDVEGCTLATKSNCGKIPVTYCNYGTTGEVDGVERGTVHTAPGGGPPRGDRIYRISPDVAEKQICGMSYCVNQWQGNTFAPTCVNAPIAIPQNPGAELCIGTGLPRSGEGFVDEVEGKLHPPFCAPVNASAVQSDTAEERGEFWGRPLMFPVHDGEQLEDGGFASRELCQQYCGSATMPDSNLSPRPQPLVILGPARPNYSGIAERNIERIAGDAQATGLVEVLEMFGFTDISIPSGQLPLYIPCTGPVGSEREFLTRDCSGRTSTLTATAPNGNQISIVIDPSAGTLTLNLMVGNRPVQQGVFASLGDLSTAIDDIPTITVAEANSCAVCEYMDFPECHTAQANANAAACAAVAPPGYRPRECEWVNDRCISRFRRSCRDFLSTITRVPQANKFITPDIPTLLRTTDLSTCTPELILRLREHSNEEGVVRLTGRTSMCIEAAPNCNSVTAFHTGCSAFSNLRSTLQEVRRFAQTIPPGTTITLGDNHAVAAEDVQSHLILTVNCAGIQSTDYGPCHNPAGEDRCGQAGETVTCREGANTLQEACCLGRFGTLIWQRGNQCPVLACSDLHWCSFRGTTMACRKADGSVQSIACCIVRGDEGNIGRWTEGTECRCRSAAPETRSCMNPGFQTDCRAADGATQREICCRVGEGADAPMEWGAGAACPRAM